MKIEQFVRDDGVAVPHYIAEPGDILVMTGPVTGIKELADGTQLNLGLDYVAVASQEQVDEVNDLIGQHWVDNGHPHDVDTLTDPDTGKDVLVQRPFVFTNSAGETQTGVGTPLGEHPLDEPTYSDAVQATSKSKGN